MADAVAGGVDGVGAAAPSVLVVQAEQGLEVDGIVGRATWGRL